MPKTQSVQSAPSTQSAKSAPSTLFIKKSPQLSTKVLHSTPPANPLRRKRTMRRSPKSINKRMGKGDMLRRSLSNKFGTLLKNKFRSFFKGKNRIALEDITNGIKMKMNPLNAENEVPSRGKATEIDSESTDKPFPTSQEYANEKVNFLMEKMKAYLYYPRGKTMDEKQADFIKHIEDYDKKYRELLKDITTEIYIIIEEQRKMGSGGGKEMHGGNQLTPHDIERLALLAIEYKRTIFLDDIINKKTIGLTLTRINATTRQTEHNILVQVPIECFIETNKDEKKVNIQRIQVGASKFEYGILSTRHVYYFNTIELAQWLRDKQANYEFPQLGTVDIPAKKISNIVFRNNIVEYEVTKKSILEKPKRYSDFVAILNPEEKFFLETNIEHFETLLLKTKNVDKVFVSLRFHPGNRGHIIYTIKQFFNKMNIGTISDKLDRYGVFQKKDDGDFEIKDVFKNLGVNQAKSSEDPLKYIHKKLNHGYEFFVEPGKALDLKKALIEEIETINKAIEDLEIKKKQLGTEQLDAEIEYHEKSRNELTKRFKELDTFDDEADTIKKYIYALIMPHEGKLPYTGLWFNLTIPGNHTWILFYVNGKFYSVGGGYNNDREYKLAFYSPDPVFDYANHWLFPLMMNNWGFIDENIIINLNKMAESIDNRTSEGFVTKDLKYSLLSNRLSSLCGYYNCASTADKILGQSIPAIYSHPSFSRGGKYTYTSQIFEALNIDSDIELVLSATERYRKIYSRVIE